MNCTICKSEKTTIVNAVDLQTNDSFAYTHCNNCGVVYLQKLLEDYSKYYSENYYSFNNKSGFIARLKYLRDVYAFSNKGLIGKIIYLIQPNTNLYSLRYLNLKPNKTLLDIGCGDGKEIKVLHQLHYPFVRGIDPFIKSDIIINNYVIVEKKDIFSIKEKFDFLTMHHAFEHVSNPVDVCRKLKSLLNPDGKILIRIPVASCFAYEHFKQDWVQFDAPRHIFLHTTKSIELICKSTGLEIESVIYDSTSFQFWGSELVKKGIPIHSASSKQIFISRFKSLLKGDGLKSKQLNQNKLGDQAIYIIRHSSQ